MAQTTAQSRYIEFLVDQFSRMGEITARPMFGGHALYCDGITFAIVASNAVYLKADEHNRPEFEARGLRPFQPYPDKPGVMQFYETPAEVFEDFEAMKHWAGGAINAARRAQARKKSKTRRTATAGRSARPRRPR